MLLRIRSYLEDFGVHSDLWSFLRTLLVLQDQKENEYLMYNFGAKKPSTRRKEDQKKEKELATLRELYLQGDVLLIDRAVSYVRKVSHKMRQYNIDNSCDDINADENEEEH